MFIELEEYNECKLNHVGGKAHNMATMINMGLPVPKGFVCPTPYTFTVSFRNGERYDEKSLFATALNSHIRHLANKTKKTWTLDHGDPLVVSVRSGAPISMPGMMDTILNIGLNRSNLERFRLSLKAPNSFAFDCYSRLIEMFAVTVKGVEAKRFSELRDAAKVFYPVMNLEAYQVLAELFEKIYLEEVGEEFPQSPTVQLLEAVNAVYKSWFSPKAEAYRKIEGISHQLGTAVTVQEMVFGNLANSATGVAFTHDPNTGEKGLYGDFLRNAQGEDVVAGTHSVLSLDKIFEDKDLKQAAKELQSNMAKLLNREKDILDVEFTIEQGKLWILQYRVAKRSTKASVRLLLDLIREGDIATEEATERLMELMPTTGTVTKSLDDSLFLGNGLGVTDGIAVGKIAMCHNTAKKYSAQEQPYIYVSTETSPNDVEVMKDAEGILTAKGGRLSHAAVVARGWNKPCVVSFDIDIYEPVDFMHNGNYYHEGDTIKIDGSTGEVWVSVNANE